MGSANKFILLYAPWGASSSTSCIDLLLTVSPLNPWLACSLWATAAGFPPLENSFTFVNQQSFTKHWRRNKSACTPGAYRGFINHTCCSAVRGMISAVCVFSSMWPKVWEEQREESIYTHTALSSENLLLFKLMMEINHFQLTHMNTLTLTRLHTCRVTLWHGGDSETPCVWFSIACGYSDAGDKVTKGFGIGLLLLNRPIGREKEGACSQAEPMGSARLLLCTASAPHGNTHTHTLTQTHTQRFDTGMQGHVWQSHDVSCGVNCPALTDRHQTDWCRTDTHHDVAVFNIIFTFLRDIKQN